MAAGRPGLLPHHGGMKRLLITGLALLASLAQAESNARWVRATGLQVRLAPSADATVVGRLEQGRRVTLQALPAGDAAWCHVEFGGEGGYVACRYLSDRPVAPPEAGQGGVPADQRWVGGSNLLLRAEPRADAAVLGRLALNTVLRQTGEDTGTGYCAVQQPGADAPRGFTACRYLLRSPLAWAQLSEPRQGGSDNPDFDPARAFWIAPSWELMAHYARRVEQQRAAQGDAAPKGPDEQLERMKTALSGHVFMSKEPPGAWQPWDGVLGEAAAPASAAQSLAAELQLWGGSFDDGQPDGSAARIAAFVRALPALPKVTASWWRGSADLAGPDEGVEVLSARFGVKVQWLHESLQPGSTQRGAVLPGIRIEQLTQPLHLISLLAGPALRDERVAPRRARVDWDPTSDYNCPDWVPGFAHGDADSATYTRNDFTPRPVRGAPTLFRFWSARPLPAGPARWTQQRFELDRAATGFVAGELRTVDLDADGIADLAWLQATGRGPGHIGPQPAHDDAWFRLLLANVAGRWQLITVDPFSYGCGC